jgi:lysophospholipase L1-like esterase
VWGSGSVQGDFGVEPPKRFLSSGAGGRCDSLSNLIKVAMLLLLAALLPAQVATGPEPALLRAGPIGRLDELNWKARHEAKLLEASSRPVHLVLLGDSITANYELAGPGPLRDYSGVWQRYYADRYTLNLGFSGDGTRSLLWRMMHGEIDSIEPKGAVVLVGTKDIGWLHKIVADTVAGIDAVVAELHFRLPAVKILLVGLLPSDRGTWAQQATAAISSTLASHYGDGRCLT